MADVGFLFFGEVNAEDAGRLAGQALVWLAVLSGVWKCFSISRRPTTNTKCTPALMFVLLAVFVGGSLGILTTMFERSRSVRKLEPVDLKGVFVGVRTRQNLGV